MRIVRSRVFIACVASMVTAVVGAGAASAGSGGYNPVDSNGGVHACYKTSNGNVRLNVTGTSCPAKGFNTPITWGGQPTQTQTPAVRYAVRFKFSSAGCPAGGYQLVVAKEVGTPLGWQTVPCRTSTDGMTVNGYSTTVTGPPAGFFDGISYGMRDSGQRYGDLEAQSTVEADGLIAAVDCTLTIPQFSVNYGVVPSTPPYVSCLAPYIGTGLTEAQVADLLAKWQSADFVFYDTTQ